MILRHYPLLKAAAFLYILQDLVPESDQSQTADVEVRNGDRNGNGDEELQINWGNGIEIVQPAAESGQTGVVDSGNTGIDFGDTGMNFDDSAGIDFGAEAVDLSGIVIEDSGEEREGEEGRAGVRPGGQSRGEG